MSYQIRKVDYYYTSVKDQPGAGYRILSQLAELGINLLAFTAVPTGPFHTQLSIFPDDSRQLRTEAEKIGLALEGPHPSLLVSGDDQLGAFAEIHLKLFEANINVYSASGVTDGKGCFGYILYLRPDDIQRAEQALGLS